jgi:ribosomal protein L11 methyltransferase
MGFGTGHHATTRLCLAELQKLDLRGKSVLDVGTGSGVLAIAAAALGAESALGIDDDADAIQAANENLECNAVTNVTFAVRDLMKEDLPAVDVVLANLTGALVVRAASRLMTAVRDGGTLIVSGVLAAEGDDVRQAFANRTFAALVQEDEWLAFTIRSRG